MEIKIEFWLHLLELQYEAFHILPDPVHGKPFNTAFSFHYPQGAWKEKALTLWGNTIIKKKGEKKKKDTCCFGRVLSYSRIQRKEEIVKKCHIFKTTWSGCIVSVWQREGSRFLLCRVLIESTVRHQAGQYEIITPHNGHKTTDSGRGRKGFTLRDSLHAFLC